MVAHVVLAFILAFPSFVLSMTIPMYPYDCVSAPVLAPEEDCKDVIRQLKFIHLDSGRDRTYTWGRTVDKSDRSKVQLPIGLRLTPMFPGQPERNLCEVYVDNDLGRENAADVFTFADLIYAAATIIESCYPQHTGKVYPQSLTKNVYATTVYLPPLGSPAQNYTVLTLGLNGTVEDLTGTSENVAAA